MLVCYLGCIGATINRGTIRDKLKITESSCLIDFVTHLFCMPCGVCQEANEVIFSKVNELAGEIKKEVDAMPNESTPMNPPK
jgi:hypothetical protein